MVVTTKITVDLTRPNMGARVNAVQGDGNTRQAEIVLLSGGEAWKPPEGVEAAIAYKQPGGTKGLYNKLADGTAAISISGNVATVILAPQMLAVPGTVNASIVFNDAALNQLTTFPFSVSVSQNQYAGAQKVEDYIRLQWLEDKLDEYLRKAAESGAFDGRPGRDGVDGKDGEPGADGAPGADGHTPEYGVDYGTPEQIDGIAQKAAEILQPEVSQIKDDLSDKLPKSPANWEPWSESEQAVARERMGMHEPVLLEQIVLSEEASTLERSACADGTPYNLKAIYIYITLGDCTQYETRGSFAARIGNKNYIRSNASDIANTTLAQAAYISVAMYQKNGFWIGELDYHVFAQYPSSKHYFYTKFEEDFEPIKRIVLSFNPGFSFPSGSVIKIFGVMA